MKTLSPLSDGWRSTCPLPQDATRGATRRAPPGPVVDRADGIDPEHEALLVVLEMLTPAERLACVLHDLTSVPLDEIGAILDRSPDAARQLASRGRRRIRGADTTPDADPAAQQESWKPSSTPPRPARVDLTVLDS